MHRLAQLLAAGRQANPRPGHGDAADGNHPHKIQRIHRGAAGQHRAGHGHQAVDGHRLGLQLDQFGNQTGAVGLLLAQANDAAAAHLDAGLAHGAQGVEPVLVAARGHHLGVMRGAGIEVVVVVIQPGRLQGLRLVGREHAQRGAGLQPQGFDVGDHGGHFFQIPPFGAAPGGPHAKAGGPSGLGRLGRLQHLVFRQQLAGFHLGLKSLRLGAVAAVFRTAAGFDRQQGRQLHLRLGPMGLVDANGALQHRQPRLGKQILNSRQSPSSHRNLQSKNNRRRW